MMFLIHKTLLASIFSHLVDPIDHPSKIYYGNIVLRQLDFVVRKKNTWYVTKKIMESTNAQIASIFKLDEGIRVRNSKFKYDEHQIISRVCYFFYQATFL